MSFTQLANHEHHASALGNVSSVLSVNASYPNETLQEKQFIDIPDDIDTVITVMYARQHYAELEVNVNMKLIKVYDGLRLDVKNWMVYVNHVLVRCKLMTEEMMSDTKWITFQGKLVLINNDSSDDDPDILWDLVKEVFIEQNDGVSCGPIATAMIFDAFGIAGFDSGIGLDEMMGLRRTVVESVLHMLAKHIEHLNIIDPTSEKWCLLCTEEITKPQGSRIMSCCTKEFHATCMANYLQYATDHACPSCKKTSFQTRSLIW